MPQCKQAQGAFIPVIDLNKCEGKGPCIDVCPYDVLVMEICPPEKRSGLSLKGKVKSFVHGWKKAAVQDPSKCMACGECVAACPEHAIKLARA